MTIGIEESDNGTKQRLKDRLEKDQEKISKDVANNLEEVWQKIFDWAFINCPYETGTLQSTMDLVINDVGLMSGAWTTSKAITIFDSTISAGDESASRPDGYPCIYATWVHDGHFTPQGIWVPPQPWLADAIAMFEDELWDAIKRVMDALEKGED